MSTIDIRQKLHHYIETAQEKKIKAIYAMVEDEIAETFDYWNDEEFLRELSRRKESYISGHSKGYSLAEAMTEIRQAVKKVSRAK